MKRDLGIKKCSFQMLEALRMSLPIASYDQGIFKKSKRNALGSGLASIYPFVSCEMSDEVPLPHGERQVVNCTKTVDTAEELTQRSIDTIIIWLLTSRSEKGTGKWKKYNWWTWGFICWPTPF